RPPKAPTKVMARPLRADLRETPRNSRKKARTAAGMAAPVAMTARSQRSRPVIVKRNWARYQEARERQSTAKRLRVLARRGRSSIETARATAMIAARRVLWVRISTGGYSTLG